MASRLFVGNLPYEATESELSAHFSQAGPVSRVFMPLDRDTGKPRGFAFIEFDDAAHAAAAIQQFNQKPFMDRPLVVNEARPSEARGSGPGARGPVRPSGGRPSGPPRSFDSSSGETGKPGVARRSAPSKPRRRGGKRSFWEAGPKKEPIPEKRRSQLLGGFDDGDEDDSDVDFDDIATSLPDEESKDDTATSLPDAESSDDVATSLPNDANEDDTATSLPDEESKDDTATSSSEPEKNED